MSPRERQLAYLEAMGLRAWKPRSADARPSRAPLAGGDIEVAEAPAAEADQSAPPPSSDRPREAQATVETATPDSQPVVSAAPKAEPAPIAPRSLPSFAARDRGRVLIVCAAAEGDEGGGDPYEGELASLFDKMLKATDWSAEDVAITDAVDSPRGAILATGAEVIVAFGVAACRQLWGVGAMPGHLRGRAVPLFGAHAIATFHPAAVHRDPSLKRPVWDDLKRAIEVLGQ